MKGADQCPKCGSRAHADVGQPVTAFYARTLRVCANCRCAWEPFERADVLHPEEMKPPSSFREPCNNCAFRPNSPEQLDPERWAELMAALKAQGIFYCHKGVPIDVKGEDGFDYPKRPDGTHDTSKLRICRGYLNMFGSRLQRMKAAEEGALA